MALRLRLLVLVVAFALGGCGLMWEPPPEPAFTDLSAKEMVKVAERHVKDADSITVKGKVREDGTTGKLHMRFAPQSSSGTIDADGGSIKVLAVGAKTYMKADEAAYRSTGLTGAAAEQRVLDLIADQWIDTRDWKIREVERYASRFGFFSDFSKTVGKATKGRARNVKGTVCIPVTDREGTIFLDASDGAPILLIGRGSFKGSRFTISYGPVADFKPPRAADVVTISEIKKAVRR